MRFYTFLLAAVWIGGVAWFGWTLMPHVPLDVSAGDPATVEALQAARLRHVVVFGAIGLGPAALMIWLGRRSSR